MAEKMTQFTMRLPRHIVAVVDAEAKKRKTPFSPDVPHSALHREALEVWAKALGYDLNNPDTLKALLNQAS